MKKLNLTFVLSSLLLSSTAIASTTDNNTNALNEKLNAYIGCFNDIDQRAHQSIERYESWVKNMDKGPTGKEKHIYGLYTLSEYGIENCQKNVPAAIALTPAETELDNTAQAYLDSVISLNEKLNQAHKYYERGNYKDDKFAQGKEMHKPLAQAMKDYEEKSKAFSTLVDNANNKRLENQLKELEAAGEKNLRYWSLATMLHADKLANLMMDEKFDAEKAAALVNEYEKVADGLSEYKTEDSLEKSKLARLKQLTEDFRIAAKERMRRVRDKTPYSTSDKMLLSANNAWMVAGSPHKLQRAYNRLIEAFNR